MRRGQHLRERRWDGQIQIEARLGQRQQQLHHPRRPEQHRHQQRRVPILHTHTHAPHYHSTRSQRRLPHRIIPDRRDSLVLHFGATERPPQRGRRKTASSAAASARDCQVDSHQRHGATKLAHNARNQTERHKKWPYERSMWTATGQVAARGVRGRSVTSPR